VLNSLTKWEYPVCQTGVSGFDSSNFTVNFVKILESPIHPFSRRHQWTFSWFSSSRQNLFGPTKVSVFLVVIVIKANQKGKHNATTLSNNSYKFNA
jgi:hypothetical protein